MTEATGWEDVAEAPKAAEEAPVVRPAPDPVQIAPVVTPEPEPEPVVSKEQRWVCVEATGPRSTAGGVPHPAFHSDAHLVGEMVRCPTCGGWSVRKATAGE